MRRARRHQVGFTLIEVLIAMAIIIIGITVIMKVFPVALRQTRVAQERKQAAQLAEDRLGRIRFAGARNLMFNFSEGLPGLSAEQLQATSASYNVYDSYFTSVSRMRGAHKVYLQRVNFIVEMPDGRREQFVTYVTDF